MKRLSLFWAVAILVVLFVFPSCGRVPSDTPRTIAASSIEAKQLAFAAAVAQGGSLFISANTGSMKPTIGDGWYLVAVKVPYGDLKVGDIVNYRPKWNHYQMTVHRLVLKDSDGFIASGDANAHSEAYERVTAANYDSKVVGVYGFR